jgi:hypothetical protein
MEDFRRDYVKEHLQDLTLEERLAGLTLEQLLARVSPEQLLAALSPEAKEALRQQLHGEEPPSPSK